MNSYQVYMKNKEEEYESLCKRCGRCCGVLNDPCVHLKKDEEDKFFCEIYDHRLGEHKTQSGNTFQCVPVRKILHKDWVGKENCVYYQ